VEVVLVGGSKSRHRSPHPPRLVVDLSGRRLVLVDFLTPARLAARERERRHERQGPDPARGGSSHRRRSFRWQAGARSPQESARHRPMAMGQHECEGWTLIHMVRMCRQDQP
jgi:hypothetical protein